MRNNKKINGIRKRIMALLLAFLVCLTGIILPGETIQASQSCLTEVANYSMGITHFYTVSEDSHKIISYNLKTGKKSSVYSAGNYFVFNIWLYGHYLYFVEGEMDCTYVFTLKRYDLKKHKVKIIDDGHYNSSDGAPLESYMVVDQHVYEVRDTNSGVVLYQMDLNGNHKKTMNINKGYVRCLYKYGNKLLYSKDYGFFDEDDQWKNTILYDLKGNKYKSGDIEISDPIGMLGIPVVRGKYTYFVDDYNDKITLIKGYDDEEGNDYCQKQVKLKGYLDSWSVYGKYFVVQLRRFENHEGSYATHTYLISIPDLKLKKVV